MDFFNTADLINDILINPDFNKPRGAEIDYEDPKEVAELIAWHLARIFRATFREKLIKEVEKLKQNREVELGGQLSLLFIVVQKYA